MGNKTQQSDETAIALLQKDTQYIKDTLNDIKHTLEAEYITRAEFEPIKKVVYGLIGLILVAVVGAIVALVIKKP